MEERRGGKAPGQPYGRQAGLWPLLMIIPRWLPSALTHWMVLADPNAITCPPGDQLGWAYPLAATSRTAPVPSSFITPITLELQTFQAQGHST
jgi:hypothetical protein